MKKIVIIVSSFLISCGSYKPSEQHFETALEQYKLKGRVKTLTSNSYRVTEKQSEIVKDYKTYNHLFEPEKLIFNSKGKLILKITNTPNREHQYNYDSEGKLINLHVLTNDKQIEYKRVYTYDSKDKLVEIKTYRPNDSVSSIETYKYNSEGYDITKIIYDSNNKVSNKKLHKYNLKGNILKKYTKSDQKKVSLTIYKYDPKGNLIEVLLDLNGSETFRFNLKNNSKGELLENQIEGFYLNKKIKQKYSFKYDSYDEKGNWLKLMEYQNDTIKRTVGRTIEYFE